MPRITVVIATWNRGPRIIPTLQSALWQTFEDFEIIVVGDGCTDDTADALQPYLGDRVRWINLSRNCGIQSFPNNVGIAAARGEFIAYLGHDDIWSKDHLQQLIAVFDHNPTVDFAVSGLIIHGPEDSNFETVLGLFENDDAKFTDVFAPSSVMHRRSCAKKIGLWRSPQKCRAPVDVDFQNRAARAGCQYKSTGQVTSHKISAAQRYLCYLNQSSSEQQEMLQRLAAPGYQQWRDDIVLRCKNFNRYMVDKIQDYSGYQPGAIGLINRFNRGLKIPPLQALKDFTTIEQSDDVRGLDWFELVVEGNFRWAGPNPRPKILIPYTSMELVQFGLEIPHINIETRAVLAVRVNDQPVAVSFMIYGASSLVVEFQARLLPDRVSIIELYAPPGRGDWARNSVALGKILMAPVSLM